MSAFTQITVQIGNADAFGATALNDTGFARDSAMVPPCPSIRGWGSMSDFFLFNNDQTTEPHPMNTTDWTSIPLKLKAAGFTVSYDRISYEPTNPLWRAKAQRDDQEWTTLERDLESALTALERQTQEPKHNWREVSAAA
jgi:hypothetical protein